MPVGRSLSCTRCQQLAVGGDITASPYFLGSGVPTRNTCDRKGALPPSGQLYRDFLFLVMLNLGM